MCSYLRERERERERESYAKIRFHLFHWASNFSLLPFLERNKCLCFKEIF